MGEQLRKLLRFSSRNVVGKTMKKTIEALKVMGLIFLVAIPISAVALIIKYVFGTLFTIIVLVFGIFILIRLGMK